MKKIKWLMPTLGIAALGSAVLPAITSCSSISINDILEIDSNHVLHGFKSKYTMAEIEKVCNGTLTIPADVIRIAPYAFCDRGTLKSTLPSSVKKLTFAKDKDGRNHLQGSTYDGLMNEAAIGAYSFANSPFEDVEFPLDLIFVLEQNRPAIYGHNYDIDEGAFMGSKIKTLKMPHPGYITTQEQANEFTEPDDVIGWWNLYYINEDGKKVGGQSLWENVNKWDIISAAGLKNINKNAFVNCDNLKSVIESCFQTVKDNKFDEAKIDVHAFGTFDQFTQTYTSSKINYLDFSFMFPWIPITNEMGKISKIKSLTNECITNGRYNVYSMDYSGFNLDMNIAKGIIKAPIFSELNFILGDTSTGVDYFNRLLNSLNKNQDIFAANMIGQNLSDFNPCYLSSSGNASNWIIPRSIQFINPEYTQKDPYLDNIYMFKDNEISIKVADINKNIQYLRKDTKPDESEEKFKFFLPDDVKFNVTETTWEGSNKIDVSLRQLARWELPDEEECKGNYMNQCYRVTCAKTPTAGSSVTLKVAISSKSHNIDLAPISLKINFTQE